MRFDLSDAQEEIDEVVEIETIEELKGIDEAHGGHGLIIDFGSKHFDPSILIYNNWIE